MKKLLISTGGTVGVLLVFLSVYLYPLDYGFKNENPKTTQIVQLPQVAEVVPIPTNIPETSHSKKQVTFSKKDAYLLMKIAMAEAEDEDIEGKSLVMRVVLNRVKNKEFPNSIRRVIYQERQFSPIANGRFDRVEPNEDCQKALNMISEDGWDESRGALYFESKSDSTWHEDNLQFLFRHGRHYFYTNKMEDFENE